MRWHADLAAITAGVLLSTPAAAVTYGAREHVRLSGPPAIEIVAALDPSATHASLRVRSLKFQLHEDGTWVRFVVDSGDVVTLKHAVYEARVQQDRKIALRDGGLRHEPVVPLSFCVGDHRFTAPVALLLQQGYTPPMTLGAPQISVLGHVDAGARFLHEPSCATTVPVPSASAPPPAS